MKWIKPYNLYNESNENVNWYEYPNFININKLFNVLFFPIGVSVTKSYINTTNAITVSYKISFDFSWNKVYSSNSLDISNELLMTVNDKLNYVCPVLNNDEALRDLIIDFYEDNLPNSEEEAIIEIIKYLLYMFKSNVSDKIIDNLTDSIEFPLFKNIIISYCEYLLKIKIDMNTTHIPNQIYKIVYDELSKDKNVFKIISKIKDTDLYLKLKSVGNVDKFLTATDMGDMGF